MSENEFHSYQEKGGTATVERQMKNGREQGHITQHSNGNTTDYTDGQYQNGKKTARATVWDGSSSPENKEE